MSDEVTKRTMAKREKLVSDLRRSMELSGVDPPSVMEIEGIETPPQGTLFLDEEISFGLGNLTYLVASLIEVPPSANLDDYCERVVALDNERLDGLHIRGEVDPVSFLVDLQMTGSEVIFAETYLLVKKANDCVESGDFKTALRAVTLCASQLLVAVERAQEAKAEQSASHAAHASHASHKANKQKARDWYAAHNTLTKDAAAEKMANDRVVHAACRTIRGYLVGQ